MSELSTLEWVLRRDRAVTAAALALIAGLSWAYTIAQAGMAMPAMPMADMMTGMAPMPWTPAYFGMMVAMWAVMMVAMMVPSAAPMILLFAAVERRKRQAAPHAATARFAFGYLVVWSGFGLTAAGLQWGLERLALLSPTMAATNAVFAGGVLIAAGLYQFTPLKHACLRHCRSPLEFLSQHWGQGPLRMGISHGLYCVGCCWMLMALLFVGGVMNLLWVALIALYVLVEKIGPRGRWTGHAAGAGLVLWGGATWLAVAA